MSKALPEFAAVLAVLLGTTALAADGDGKADQPADAAQPAFVIIFDFDAPDLGKLGEQLSRSVFGKVKRQQVEGMTLIDPMTAADASQRYKVNYDAAPARVATVLSGELAANVGVVGRLSRQGESYTAKARLIDLRTRGDDWTWERTFTAEGERARGLLADQIAQVVTGLKVDKPLEVGYDPEPDKLGPAVTPNGDFETENKEKPGTPAGWGPIDGLTTFWEKDPAGRRGQILRVNTDVYEWQWKAWRAKLAKGAKPADAPRRVPTKGPKYDTVAGTYGIHVHGQDIDAKPGMRYRVLADMKGKTTDFFFPKVFVKGYREIKTADESEPQYREVWRTYLACRNFEGEWKHYSQTLLPAAGVQKLRVIIYSYWPPGVYEWDNVRLVEEPLPTTRPNREPGGRD